MGQHKAGVKRCNAAHLALPTSFSHAAGEEIAAQLMTTSTGPRWSKHCCMPSPVGRSSYITTTHIVIDKSANKGMMGEEELLE